MIIQSKFSDVFGLPSRLAILLITSHKYHLRHVAPSHLVPVQQSSFVSCLSFSLEEEICPKIKK